MPIEIKLKDMDEIILILPDGKRVSIVYDTVEDQPSGPGGSVPELDILFNQSVMYNTHLVSYGNNGEQIRTHDPQQTSRSYASDPQSRPIPVRGPDNPHPTVCNQIVVCIGDE